MALTIMRIIAPNPGPMTGQGTNTFIIGDATGCLVIDPGDAAPTHLDAIAATGATLGGIRGIIITHGHPDHLGGAATLAAQVVAPIFACSTAPDAVPFADEIVHDGQMIQAGNEVFSVLATPGHRFDHLCLWHAASGTLFAGDLVAGTGTVVIIPPEGDMRTYLASLERVNALPLRRIWAGHGPAIIDDPHSRIAGLIAHRLAREQQVIAALSAATQPLTVTQLVPIVYADTDPTMYGWAARSLLAHLIKLAADGKARQIVAANDSDALWERVLD